MNIPLHQDTILGCYLPSFFKIDISTNAASLSAFTEDNMSTYTHEYIHFLQNITTVYGLSTMVSLYHIVCEFFSDIDNCKNFQDCHSSFRAAVAKTPGRSEELEELFHQQQIPNSPDLYLCGKIINIETCKDTYICKIYFQNEIDPRIPFEYCLNGSIMYEGMAHIIEKNIFPNDDKIAPRFPYNILREASNYLIPSPQLSDEQLIQLCDLSLQTTVPGFDFIENLKQIKQGKTVDWLWQQETVSYDRLSGQEVSSHPPHAGCKIIIEGSVFNEILSCTFDGETRSVIADYIKELCLNGANFREKKGRFLFSDLLKENPKTISNTLQTLHGTIGAPNIFRAEDMFYLGAYAKKQAGASYLPILYSIYNAVCNNSLTVPCPYRSDCSAPDHKYFGVYNSANCDVNFLLNINHCKEFCMAKSLAFSMGLGLLHTP